MKSIISLFILFCFLFIITAKAKWERISPEGLYLNLYGVHFIDADTGYVTGWNDVNTARILKTTNGGKDWQEIIPPASYIFGVNAVGYNKIYVVGYNATTNCGLLFKSTDAGISWNSILFNGSPNPSSFGYYTYEPINNTTALMSGYQGSIVKTTDAGETWAATNTNTSDVFRVLNFANETIGYAAGGEGFSFNLINAIYKTTDGGNNWFVIRPRSNDISIGNIQFISPDTGFVFGYYNGSASILKTTDGGNSFSPIYTGGSNLGFQSGDFLNSNLGIGVGDNGLILLTKDGGKTWTEEKGITTEVMIWAHYVDEKTCYVVGLNGEMYKYTDDETEVIETKKNLNDDALISPNPCTSLTYIKYSVPEPSTVKLKIYDSFGSLVSVVLDEFQNEGMKSVQINVENLTSGVYYYRLESGNRISCGKIVIVK
ncbi:MAG: T9SS type A sorting domain-containing protein [Bacteroidetes bacterium]|nr:MAG: T9SS type A sorting domain-containing protein [Bacteroidota bacterium]